MREYGRVSPGFWIGETGKAIKSRGSIYQVAALYLITSPHANMCGLYYLPKLYMSHESGVPLEALDEVLEGLKEIGFATYDSKSEFVFVHRMAEYQLGGKLDPSDNRVKGLIKTYKALPKGLLSPLFEAQYPDIFPKKQKPSQSPSEALPKQLTGKARQGKDIEPNGSSAEATKSPTAVAVLPLLSGGEFQVSADYLAKLSDGYPAIDVGAELKQMALWLDANPKNQKTEKGIKRFITQWLGRSQNSAPRAASPQSIDIESLIRQAVAADRTTTANQKLDEACKRVGWGRLMGMDPFNRKALIAEVEAKYAEVMRGR